MSDARRDGILSVTIEGGRFTAGIVTFRGELLDRTRADVDPDVGPQSHFAVLARIVGEQRDRAHDQHNVRVRAIGVGVRRTDRAQLRDRLAGERAVVAARSSCANICAS